MENTTLLGNLICSVYDAYRTRYDDPEFAALATEVTLNDLLLRLDVHDPSLEDRTDVDFFPDSCGSFDGRFSPFKNARTDANYLGEFEPFDIEPFDIEPFDIEPFDIEPFDNEPFDNDGYRVPVSQ